MLIKTLPVGQLETNCYIVTDEASLKCVVIDPGADSNTILDYIESNHLAVEAIFLTHGHFDHTTAVSSVNKAANATVWINEQDCNYGNKHDSLKFRADVNTTRFYSEGDIINVGNLFFTVMETPGHSAGSVSIMCENALFTGDTLFKDSCGRTDLAGGDMGSLLRSLLRLYNLEGDFEVYPGHAEVTSLDYERNFNYYMKYAKNELE